MSETNTEQQVFTAPKTDMKHKLPYFGMHCIWCFGILAFFLPSWIFRLVQKKRVEPGWLSRALNPLWKYQWNKAILYFTLLFVSVRTIWVKRENAANDNCSPFIISDSKQRHFRTYRALKITFLVLSVHWPIFRDSSASPIERTHFCSPRHQRSKC